MAATAATGVVPAAAAAAHIAVENDSSADEYEDAVPNVMPSTSIATKCGSSYKLSGHLAEALMDVNNSINFFFNNQFKEAKKLCRSKSSTSMYHSLGESTLLFLEAVMTFEQDDILSAITSIKTSVQLCESYRKKHNLMGKVLGVGREMEHYTDEELHAEVIFAELNLFHAFLTFIQDENLVNFLKGALKIRQGYRAYKDCQTLLTYESIKKKEHIHHFIGAVNLGCGCFNVGMSLLPPRVVSLLKWIGFESDKNLGLKQIMDCYTISNLRSSLSSLIILSYHLFISPFVGSFDCDIDLAKTIIDRMLVKFPNGVYFHFFAGRLQEFFGNYDKAIEHLNKAATLQNEWRQFSHFCYWELMWCCSYQLDWKAAAQYANLLIEESNWSKCLYTYLYAIFLYEMDPTDEENMKHITQLMISVPGLKQRIAGKSIPTEKFVSRKSRKFLEQGNHLVAPVHELLSVWKQVFMLKKNPEMQTLHMQKINEEFVELEKKKNSLSKTLNNNYSTSEYGKCFFYYDDYCLLQNLKGNLLECEGKNSMAELCYTDIKEKYKGIIKDHYLAPSAMADLCSLLVKQERYEEAKNLAKFAKKTYSHYSMESRVHFRLHAVLTTIKERTGKD